MSQAPSKTDSADVSLTALLVPLGDRNLLLPNVAVAELIPYRNVQRGEGLPDWFLGQIGWRDLQLPLLSFEAASGGVAHLGPDSRVAVINALGNRPRVKFLAVVVQGIPRSLKVSSDLVRAGEPLAPMELDAVRIGDLVASIPDLVGLEQKLADLGVI